ncbi:hypothetical protein Micbo1qcDRAFT_9191 [Microdochium bolleyi]|uniref:Uncharacterized protein n=1 Tax=Microdochium bolleyi TaxID=196109 RepID=A0A136JKI5_9PEZI|nr:hypothetical protein Micbo1qcDRAFT_9191 [Microdochium bolleyi]
MVSVAALLTQARSAAVLSIHLHHHAFPSIPRKRLIDLTMDLPSCGFVTQSLACVCSDLRWQPSMRLLDSATSQTTFLICTCLRAPSPCV